MREAVVNDGRCWSSRLTPQSSLASFRRQQVRDGEDPLLNPGIGGSETEGRVWKSPLLLLVPSRLGVVRISDPGCLTMLGFHSSRQSVGCLGGTPRHAIYFYGSVGDRLIGKDPHWVQREEEGGRFEER